ncbi:hypothetical protein [Dictyobacter kobayashii]|uniref:Uncharacterized protein n=1 Tax=Dictyobacter kobayashii TaxID=2014872 RepID=A0A402AVT4_9CHLR|nr:hypothetical protein [Dictyobacter kobayashii]GCE23232.1 hypothetical protein KDK_70320 [Dictyobacter kobayashii]
MSTPSAGTSTRYQIPTHLNVPDKIALPLFGITFHITIRQGLIFLLGWSTAFNLWNHLEGLDVFGPLGLVLRVSFPVLLAVATLVTATMQFGGCYVEEWAALFLRYRLKPPVSLWRPISIAERTSGPVDLSTSVQEEEEEMTAWL